MSHEFDALMHNDTWDLVPPSPTQNFIGCKWIFRIKQNADGLSHCKGLQSAAWGG